MYNSELVVSFSAFHIDERQGDYVKKRIYVESAFSHLLLAYRVCTKSSKNQPLSLPAQMFSHTLYNSNV